MLLATSWIAQATESSNTYTMRDAEDAPAMIANNCFLSVMKFRAWDILAEIQNWLDDMNIMKQVVMMGANSCIFP